MLQLCNRKALLDLEQFLDDPNLHNASRLRSVPAIFNILHHEYDTDIQKYPDLILALCSWIFEQGQTVLQAIMVHKAPGIDINANGIDGGWEKVCSFYICADVCC